MDCLFLPALGGGGAERREGVRRGASGWTAPLHYLRRLRRRRRHPYVRRRAPALREAFAPPTPADAGSASRRDPVPRECARSDASSRRAILAGGARDPGGRGLPVRTGSGPERRAPGSASRRLRRTAPLVALGRIFTMNGPRSSATASPSAPRNPDTRSEQPHVERLPDGLEAGVQGADQRLPVDLQRALDVLRVGVLAAGVPEQHVRVPGGHRSQKGWRPCAASASACRIGLQLRPGTIDTVATRRRRTRPGGPERARPTRMEWRGWERKPTVTSGAIRYLSSVSKGRGSWRGRSEGNSRPDHASLK